MKMLCFKLQQKRTINKEFDFWGIKGAEGGGEGVPRFQKFEKATHRTVVPTHTENISTLATLENV